MAKKLIIIALLFLGTITAFAQTNNHPTVASFKVNYKPETGANQSSGMKCIPNATITLKPNSNAVKVYFKIMTVEESNVIYQVNYMLNSAAVNNNEGKKLFENNNGAIFISNGQALNLKPYSYQIETEDANGNKTTVYSAVR